MVLLGGEIIFVMIVVFSIGFAFGRRDYAVDLQTKENIKNYGDYWAYKNPVKWYKL